MISSTDLLKKAGIGSRRTLIRWHQQKLIPRPKVKRHPSGRGTVAYWPNWVVDHCLEIRERLKSGQSLDAIRQELGSDWKAIQRRWHEEPSIREMWLREQRETASQKFAIAVHATLNGLLLNIKREYKFLAGLALEQLEDMTFAERALKVLRNGTNPVLIFDGKKLSLIPDSDVPKLLSKRNSRRPLIVLPIRRYLEEAFAAIEPVTPVAPS